MPIAQIQPAIQLRGVRQNNLRGFDLDIPLGQLVVITGVSGSGKSSLAFDTLYAEGQRRYVECLSSYARQFLERMDKPQVNEITGILPSVALRQGKSIRAARATVATLTELGEYFRLVYAHASSPICPNCGARVERVQSSVILNELLEKAPDRRAVVTFELPVVSLIAARAALENLAVAGYHRAWQDGKIWQLADLLTEDRIGQTLHIVQDRAALTRDERSRWLDSLQQAAKRGGGTVSIWLEGAAPALVALREIERANGFTWLRATSALRCAVCATAIAEPSSHLFSFNSAVGACEKCNGFGRSSDMDLGKIIPDARKSLADGAIKPWQTENAADEQRDLLDFCARNAIDSDVPWADLPQENRDKIVSGEKGGWRAGKFYGIRGWFQWLESKQYKMHVRVMLARYRTYLPCDACKGARLRPEALAWLLGGLALPALMALPIRNIAKHLTDLHWGDGDRAALQQPLREIEHRLDFLAEVGLDYLSLDRAARSLSSGELQRVQLVAALATGMTQVLYVLDEPSVGLHPRDNDRLLRILERLRAAGNTVVVVEHDPALMLAADTLIDLGPGAGELGGELVFVGPPSQLASAKNSLTADYLLGARQVATAQLAQSPSKTGQTDKWIHILAPTSRTLKGQDVRLKMGALNAVCGVSGSGKSTLIEEILYRNLLRSRGEMVEEPGACSGVTLDERIAEVILIDQELPHGSSRANCATYLKLWDLFRARLAADPLAAARGYTSATFSFNRAGGRCEVCEGLGFESVDMQFLSDVQIACEACEGKRFRFDVLQVRYRGMNAAEMLEHTAHDLARICVDEAPLRLPLEALCELGLGYVRLGQPLSTLSGGEAQRLKIVHHLLQARTKQALFLLDEPSTGLHLHDVHILLQNLRKLTDRGNTVVMVEHHLDLIAAADHIVELGPDGGPDGGHVLYQGNAQDFEMLLDSPTALHLRRRNQKATGLQPVDLTTIDRDPGHIAVRGARVHNLRNISLDIPRDRFVVVTGLSGSGKSSLAFDVLFAEGQRRFLDCLSPYARQYLPPTSRPDLDQLLGLPPTVAISQRTTRGGDRSTVATLTDIYPYLRLLYARCGTQLCPICRGPVSGQSEAEVADAIEITFTNQTLYVMAPVIRGRKGHHKDLVDRAKSLGHQWLHVDQSLCPINAVPPLRRHAVHDIDYVVARIAKDLPRRADAVAHAVAQALALGDGAVVARTSETQGKTWSLRRHCAVCAVSVEPPDPRLFTFTSAAGWCPHCQGKGIEPPPVDAEKKPKKKQKKPDPKSTAALSKAALPDGGEKLEEMPVRSQPTCTVCAGSRLRAEARSVLLGGKTIDVALTDNALATQNWLQGIVFSRRDRAVAAPILSEVTARCSLLSEIGLNYLALGRGAPTLSGGESQRIRLAAQLSSNLRGVLYVLDEPTIGLHPSDNKKLLRALDGLVQRGNGLLVVEHDEETIRRADHLIELGPGGGRLGGKIVFEGNLQQMLVNTASPTGIALREGALRRTQVRATPTAAPVQLISLVGATRHNLHDVTAHFARGQLNVVTGVSGSGKSTLVRDLLVDRGNRGVSVTDRRQAEAFQGDEELRQLQGLDGLGRIVEVDQSPIGRTPRSCPATYMGIFDDMRNVFAALPDAKVQGLSANQFSFNVAGGRCEACSGGGQVKVEMSFLPTVFIACDSCSGSRYGERVLQVRFKGASMADVLAMNISEAAEHFSKIRTIAGPLQLAERMGLGYLSLGQGSNTLSGGEAQRLKIVTELCKKRRFETLYVLDEPSTGLHLQDLQRLIALLRELVDRGNTVIVIEHQLDIVREADWLVDLGPGAGEDGGKVQWCGPVGEFLRSKSASLTWQALLAEAT